MSDPDDIPQSLVERPRETINIELKSWIDPKSPEGEQKIARAALALRNQNGGHLVIGFNDKTSKPDPVPLGVNVRLRYHADEIQRIVTRYASHPFFIEVHFPETGGIEYPVIRIPAGFKTPVVCKSDLSVKGSDGKEKFLMRAKDIYVRTVDTNHTVSSAPGSGRDIELVERCFQNREADHTALLSKTFQAIPSVNLPAIFKAIGAVSVTGLEASEGFKTIFDKGEERYSATMSGRTAYHHLEGFLNIALVIQGLTKNWEPNFDFLRTLSIANPELTGWPIWLISDTWPSRNDQPYFWHDTYEQYIYRQAHETASGRGHLDFSIYDPNGRFFLRRAFEDDMGAEGVKAVKTIEIYIQAWRIAEALAVGRAFANALGASVETALSFAFRWSGIKNREIDLWAHPGAEFMSAQASRQDISQCEVNIAASANDEELIARTIDALQKLVLPFGDVRIPRQFLSDRLRTNLFKHPVA